METREPVDRATLSELSRPFWILFAFSFAGILVLAGLLSVTLNRNAIQSSEQVFEAAVSNRLNRLSTLTQEYGYWDEAVANLVKGYDPSWIANTFDAYIFETLGVHGVYVVDAQNASVVSIVENEQIEGNGIAPFGEPMAALIRDARATEDDTAPVPTAGIVAADGAYFLAVAVRMTTYDGGSDTSTDHVMAFVEAIDQEALSAIASNFMLPGLKIADAAPETWQAGMPVRLYPGLDDRYFVWQPELPGFKILPAMIAGVLVAFLVMMATAISFMRRGNRLMGLLAAAQAKADAANRAKSEFLRNVTHELRTPLNAIVGFADIISRESFGTINNKKYVEYAQDIRSAGDHGLAVVDDLLDLEKIEAGEMAYEYSTFGTFEIAEEAMNYVRQIAAEKSIALALDDTGGLPQVRSDRWILRQMLMNLLSNAVKFTPAAGNVTCRIYRCSDSEVAIEVRDTGEGLTPDQIRTVLEPFGQIRSSEGKDHRGSGLGLPLTKKLTESLGGTFRFESVLGEGTTATIILPGSG